jgi:hypothetical protein
MISRRKIFGFIGAAATVPATAVLGKEQPPYRDLILSGEGPHLVRDSTFTGGIKIDNASDVTVSYCAFTSVGDYAITKGTADC